MKRIYSYFLAETKSWLTIMNQGKSHKTFPDSMNLEIYVYMQPGSVCEITNSSNIQQWTHFFVTNNSYCC